ncbi:hypothetical protein EON64_15480 [archaeon]|nr:MAG: hypothetical protein EON64_15480 [archaeon]
MVLSTGKGAVIRQWARDITIQSRTATGILLQNTEQDDYVVKVDIISPAAGDDTGAVQAQP